MVAPASMPRANAPIVGYCFFFGIGCAFGHPCAAPSAQPHLPLHASNPSRTMGGSMSSAASGSAHHQSEQRVQHQAEQRRQREPGPGNRLVRVGAQRPAVELSGDPQLDKAIELMTTEVARNPYVPPTRPKYPDRSGMGGPEKDW